MSEQQKDSPLEQLAQRFEVYASDCEAMVAGHRARMFNKGARSGYEVKARHWREAARELRDVDAQLREKDRQLLLCSISTGLPVAE